MKDTLRTEPWDCNVNYSRPSQTSYKFPGEKVLGKVRGANWTWALLEYSLQSVLAGE